MVCVADIGILFIFMFIWSWSGVCVLQCVVSVKGATVARIGVKITLYRI